MKFGNREVFQLGVFDNNGTKVALLDTLKESQFYHDERKGFGYIVIKDALLDEDILKFIGKAIETKLNDFERSINQNTSKNKITISSKQGRACKLIARALLREQDSHKDREFLFEFPKARIINSFTFAGFNQDVSQFDLIFEIAPFNEDEDLYIIHY